MYYSRKTNGFYTLEIHGDNMPDDCVRITDDEWAALLNGQSEGQEIDIDHNDLPILKARTFVEPSAKENMERKIQAEMRAMAIERLKSKGEFPLEFNNIK